MLMALRAPVALGFTRGFSAQMTDAIHWQRQAEPTRWIFATESALAPCVDRNEAYDLGRVNRYKGWIFPADAVIGGYDPIKGDDQTDEE
jgi:hypothetical protein